jgi:hypothetical protein
VGQLGDFVFYAELLALEVGDTTIVRQGSRILFVYQVLQIGMLGLEFLNALHVGHYRASISQLISARDSPTGKGYSCRRELANLDFGMTMDGCKASS